MTTADYEDVQCGRCGSSMNWEGCDGCDGGELPVPIEPRAMRAGES